MKSILVFFDKLKSLSLDLEPLYGVDDDESADDVDSMGEIAENESSEDQPMLLQPLNSLTFRFYLGKPHGWTLGLVEEIMSSWLSVKRISFDVGVEVEDEDLAIVTSKFFDSRFPLWHCVPASWQLEECHWLFSSAKSCLNVVPRAVIPRAAWVLQNYLLNLKVLILDLDRDARLEPNSFAAIVSSTPYLEKFSGDFGGGDGLSGLRLMDLVAVCGWRRLRTCSLTIDITEEDLASPPPETQRKFVKLKNSYFAPNLVQQWKERLEKLEMIDISCRIVEGDKYRINEFDSDIDRVAVYPMIFGSTCDCGKVHFYIDAEDAAAKRYGFLQNDD